MNKTPILLIIALAVIWLLLNTELSLLSLAFGLVLGLLLVLAIGQLRPVRPRVRNLHVAVPLVDNERVLVARQSR